MLTGPQLDGWLDNAQSRLPGTLTVIIEGNQSGRLVTDLKGSGGRDRIVITSHRMADTATFLNQGGLTFSRFFWDQTHLTIRILFTLI